MHYTPLYINHMFFLKRALFSLLNFRSYHASRNRCSHSFSRLNPRNILLQQHWINTSTSINQYLRIRLRKAMRLFGCRDN
ncbi:hypothetical protein CW304_05045 [Bacillus sp. UFRGS-B20]|nr:hypothetical protein CW304_05045 [Bacillus sp. UFRGS-B20]